MTPCSWVGKHVLVEPASSIFCPEEGSRVPRKNGTHLPDHTQVDQNLVLRNYFAKFQQCFLKAETSNIFIFSQ